MHLILAFEFENEQQLTSYEFKIVPATHTEEILTILRLKIPRPSKMLKLLKTKYVSEEFIGARGNDSYNTILQERKANEDTIFEKITRKFNQAFSGVKRFVCYIMYDRLGVIGNRLFVRTGIKAQFDKLTMLITQLSWSSIRNNTLLLAFDSSTHYWVRSMTELAAYTGGDHTLNFAKSNLGGSIFSAYYLLAGRNIADVVIPSVSASTWSHVAGGAFVAISLIVRISTLLEVIETNNRGAEDAFGGYGFNWVYNVLAGAQFYLMYLDPLVQSYFGMSAMSLIVYRVGIPVWTFLKTLFASSITTTAATASPLVVFSVWCATFVCVIGLISVGMYFIRRHLEKSANQVLFDHTYTSVKEILKNNCSAKNTPHSRELIPEKPQLWNNLIGRVLKNPLRAQGCNSYKDQPHLIYYDETEGKLVFFRSSLTFAIQKNNIENVTFDFTKNGCELIYVHCFSTNGTCFTSKDVTQSLPTTKKQIKSENVYVQQTGMFLFKSTNVSGLKYINRYRQAVKNAVDASGSSVKRDLLLSAFVGGWIDVKNDPFKFRTLISQRNLRRKISRKAVNTDNIKQKVTATVSKVLSGLSWFVDEKQATAQNRSGGDIRFLELAPTGSIFRSKKYNNSNSKKILTLVDPGDDLMEIILEPPLGTVEKMKNDGFSDDQTNHLKKRRKTESTKILTDDEKQLNETLEVSWSDIDDDGNEQINRIGSIEYVNLWYYLFSLKTILDEIFFEQSVCFMNLVPRNLSYRFFRNKNTEGSLLTKNQFVLQHRYIFETTKKDESLSDEVCIMDVCVGPALNDPFFIESIEEMPSPRWIVETLLPQLQRHEVPHLAVIEMFNLTMKKLSEFILGVSIIDTCLRAVDNVQINPDTLPSYSKGFGSYEWMYGRENKTIPPYYENPEDNTFHFDSFNLLLPQLNIINNNNKTSSNLKPVKLRFSDELIEETARKLFILSDDVEDTILKNLVKDTKILNNYLCFFGSPMSWEHLKSCDYFPSKILVDLVETSDEYKRWEGQYKSTNLSEPKKTEQQEQQRNKRKNKTSTSNTSGPGNNGTSRIEIEQKLAYRGPYTKTGLWGMQNNRYKLIVGKVIGDNLLGYLDNLLDVSDFAEEAVSDHV
jgi:hypothetical protein